MALLDKEGNEITNDIALNLVMNDSDVVITDTKLDEGTWKERISIRVMESTNEGLRVTQTYIYSNNNNVSSSIDYRLIDTQVEAVNI